MQRIIIGTAGHVDHGKSLLAKTLTGVDPDRLPEEKKRAMTIDLGFVFFPINEHEEVAIIDVPGHERFLRTMIAGANSIRMVLFVVAADEGIMPQTVEHFDVLKLLGSERGMIVITKVDRADKDHIEIIKSEIKELVKDSFLENAPIFPVSSITNEGIEEFKEALRNIHKEIKPLPDNGIFRCPIDRIFTMKGFGTIVAGTVLSGRIAKTSMIELLPAEKKTRIRNLQVHNQIVDEVFAGQRAAFNLADLTTDDVYRGCELSIPDHLEPTQVIDARVNTLSKLKKPLVNNSVVRLHKGACEVVARVITIDKEDIEPGGEGYVQFRLESPIVAVLHERFLIRSYPSTAVIGGGNLLHIYANKKGCRFNKKRIDYLNTLQSVACNDIVETILYYSDCPIVDEKELIKLTNLQQNDITAQIKKLFEDNDCIKLRDRSIVHRRLLEELKTRCLVSIENCIKANPLKVLINKGELTKVLRITNLCLLDRILEELSQEGKIELKSDGICMKGLTIKISAKAQKLSDAITAFAKEKGYQSFKIEELIDHFAGDDQATIKEMFNYLRKNEIIIELSDGKYLDKSYLEQAREKLINYLKKEGAIRAAEYRVLLGISREAARQLLDHFLVKGMTARSQGTHRLADTN